LQEVEHDHGRQNDDEDELVTSSKLGEDAKQVEQLNRSEKRDAKKVSRYKDARK
jgi:hypothetical protein